MASAEGTVIFASVGRSHYGFDVFSCDPQTLQEALLTDGISVNFNAQFVDDPLALQLAAAGDGAFAAHPSSSDGAAAGGLVYVSERTGSSSLFFNPLSKTSHGLKAEAGPVLGPLKGADVESGFYYCDKPSIANGRVIYASTKTTSKQELGLRKPTTGVFSTCLKTGETVRLSPDGVADFSPAVSPSKEWVMVASDQGGEWSGAIHELDTALCIFRAEDGSRRKLVVDRGGWPTWASDSTIFFHKKAPEDDWWSIYKLVLPENLNDLHGKQLEPERVTPPGVHAFTPAASTTGNWIAVATRRPESKHRHVEIFDLESKSFVPVTHKLHPELHHFNPFVCPTSGIIGYHRPNKNKKNRSTIPLLEPVVCTPRNVTLLRIDGAFPSVSTDGSLIAYNTDFEAEDSGVFVAKLDGSGRKRIFKGLAFTTSWNGKLPGVVYTSVGNIFAEERATVHILSLTFDVAEFHSSSSESALSATSTKILTKPGTKNNAFPSASPDGKHIVFRSGRSGHKNLYIMDAEEGEEAGIRALTEGAWVDTMPSWSPDGQWIGFSSTRDDTTGTGTNFGLYLVRPDGTDLHRVLPRDESESGHHIRGRFNHVCFSSDSRTLLFTADSAAVSAEPISVANQFQPYGELFSCNLDGTGLVRWTYNAYEDGTPCWGPIRIDPKSLSDEGVELNSDFQDCLWLNNVTDKMKQAAA